MSLLDRFNNPEKYKGTLKKKTPLETDFSNGEESVAWFIAWKVYNSDFPHRTTHTLREFGSEIFIFPQKMSPKEIFQKVRSSLGKHLNLEDVTTLDIENGKLVQNKLPNPKLHITQFNKF